MWVLLGFIGGLFLQLVLPMLVFEWYIGGTCAIILLFLRLEKYEWVKYWGIGGILKKRLNYSVVRDPNAQIPIDSDTQYVFAFAPHGIFAFGEMLTCVLNNPSEILSRTQDAEIVPLVADLLLKIPVLGQYCQMLGCESVGPDNYRYLLRIGKSVAMTPGGTREIAYYHELSQNIVKIVHRNNFLTYAFEENVDVIPIFTLGECDAYTTHKSPDALQRFCHKYFTYPFPMLAFGVFWSFWPKSGTSLTVVVGEVIQVGNYNNAGDFTEAYYTEIERLITDNEMICSIVEHHGAITH